VSVRQAFIGMACALGRSLLRHGWYPQRLLALGSRSEPIEQETVSTLGTITKSAIYESCKLETWEIGGALYRTSAVSHAGTVLLLFCM
jgi:hypothetical protein